MHLYTKATTHGNDTRSACVESHWPSAWYAPLRASKEWDYPVEHLVRGLWGKTFARKVTRGDEEWNFNSFWHFPSRMMALQFTPLISKTTTLFFQTKQNTTYSCWTVQASSLRRTWPFSVKRMINSQNGWDRLMLWLAGLAWKTERVKEKALGRRGEAKSM